MNKFMLNLGYPVLFMIAGGLFVISGILKWEIFINQPRNRSFVETFGKKTAHICNIILGIIIFLAGVYLLQWRV